MVISETPPASTSCLVLPAQLNWLRRVVLRLILLLAGGTVMVLEILGTRMIGPQFGVGLFVWTSLITVAMLALALGYWLGGKWADRRPSFRSLALILLLAALWLAVTPWMRGAILDFSWNLGIRLGSLTSATALLFFPLCLLGMVTPFAVRLETRQIDRSGSSAGRLYAISTIGSVCGSILAGFYLVPTFRIPIILATLAVTLALASLLAAVPNKRNAVLSVASLLTVALAFFVARPSAMPSELLEAGSFGSSDLRIVQYEGNRFMIVDQAVQSSLAANGRPLDKYAYFFTSRVMMARPEARNAALIGLGGGCVVKLLEKTDIKLDVVEISPQIIHSAQKHFGIELPSEQIHAADGRIFLRERPACYDVIMLDAFSSDRMAYSLVSKEGLQIAKQSLRPDGLLALNTWGIDLDASAPNEIGASIRATLQQVFPYVLAVPAAGNLLFFAADQPIEPRGASVRLATFQGDQSFAWHQVPETTWPRGHILTDDWNPIDSLNIKQLENIRVLRRRNMPPAIRQSLAWE